MYDSRNNLSSLVSDDVRSYFGDKVYDTVIPRNVRVSEAPSHGKPVLLYDLACIGSQAYVHLAGEILRRDHLDTTAGADNITTEHGSLTPERLRDSPAAPASDNSPAGSGDSSPDAPLQGETSPGSAPVGPRHDPQGDAT